MAETDQAIASQITSATESATTMTNTTKPKLHGREFYQSIGSPKFIVAPMVDRSEFAWRMLTRSYMPTNLSNPLLAYSPMLHARLFQQTPRFRDDHFQPTRNSLETTDPPPPSVAAYLDGNPAIDRPLFVQFCANKPSELLSAAQYVAPYCDAVDLNLGCPQGIAKSGHYGAFLQEDWDTIHSMINILHKELSIPVTAKMRVLETKEKTLDYAKMILSAGASILTVHGRRREQKGHNTGLADWDMIRYLRDNLPSETVLFANGNILNSGDLEECMRATGADGIMSAEGNLSDPTIFAQPTEEEKMDRRVYWQSLDDNRKGGYRLDGVLRRYMDIVYRYVLEKDPPSRNPLWVPGGFVEEEDGDKQHETDKSPPHKKRKKSPATKGSPSLKAMQGHMFGLLRPMLSTHTDVRNALARTKAGDMDGFENVLSMVERVIRQGLKEEASQHKMQEEPDTTAVPVSEEDMTFSQRTAAKYNRPWWVAQPHIRPLPEEAIASGALTVKKDNTKAAPGEKKESIKSTLQHPKQPTSFTVIDESTSELPKPALVCG